MTALKSNNRTKIDFGKVNEPAGANLPPSLTADNLFEFNLSMLDRFDPEKILYSIKEASEILNLSDDFVGARVRNGKIQATKLGDRHMINKLTLAQIMTKGV
ncbi:MAG: helix-turn-helix domain-containing protein [Ignavibacteriae bacterium]|nr:DNA-binding protein [Ignavibacteriota bacterium]NOG98803.1 helix-turn-helix domain-containing protein [Ignavibacteriota bacterium]